MFNLYNKLESYNAVIIFGASGLGKCIEAEIKPYCEEKFLFFVDNSSEKQNESVLSPINAASKFPNALWIISSRAHKESMLECLHKLDIRGENIFFYPPPPPLTNFGYPGKHRGIIESFDVSDNIMKNIGDAWIVDNTKEKYAKKYYDLAEAGTEGFWKPESVFYKRFNQLDCSNIVELACGHGRHVQKYLDRANNITLVDINQQNIDFCKERLSKESKVKYLVTEGNNFNGIESNSQTAIFTYDAMVHFEMLDILQYIKDANRILVNGGRILFHHSNAGYLPWMGWHKSHGRNFMSADIFAYLALRHGFIVLSQDIFPWGEDVDLDCLSLCEKVKGASEIDSL
jgi:ubiquinone/menaquinone biosynthesis C-methylase UbiE